MANEPNAAQALYGHLPSAAREPVQQQRNSLSEAMWPTLRSNSPQAKAREAQSREAQRYQEYLRQRSKDALLRALKEANANIDRRMRGGR